MYYIYMLQKMPQKSIISSSFQVSHIMEVYVTEVYGPHKFTVQPVGTELISMMEDMG